ncbi:hypothetical protein BV20DRAFT_151865 [Pilatotrama ljubarskyi]|nr:hypothetical protein BV20DRAFT_151865 [Pilatotrama ljubarskyi]
MLSGGTEVKKKNERATAEDAREGLKDACQRLHEEKARRRRTRAERRWSRHRAKDEGQTDAGEGSAIAIRHQIEQRQRQARHARRKTYHSESVCFAHSAGHSSHATSKANRMLYVCSNTLRTHPHLVHAP